MAVALKNRKSAVGRRDSEEFLIHVYSVDGRLLSEYTINECKHHVSDIEDAEKFARGESLSKQFGTVIVVVSNDSVDRFEQIHINVANDE